MGAGSHGDRSGPPPATLFSLFSHTSSSWHWAEEAVKHRQQMEGTQVASGPDVVALTASPTTLFCPSLLPSQPLSLARGRAVRRPSWEESLGL